MATIKVVFRRLVSEAQDGTLFFRIIHKRRAKYINTRIRLAFAEWARIEEDLGRGFLNGGGERLAGIRDRLEQGVLRLRRIVEVLDRSGEDYSADVVVDMFFSQSTGVGFVSFARRIIMECRRLGQTSACEHYASALNSFLRFCGRDEVSFDEFDSRLIGFYERFLKRASLCPNTTSYYMRKLRAIYNQAVERGLTEQRHPFRYVYTGVARTRKRAVSIGTIRRLRDLDLKSEPLTELARDMFLFSFYTRGMSMVDMSYLKKSDLKNGVLSYCRQKTTQRLFIRWESPMAEIVSRYEIPDSEYMLPLIRREGPDKRRQYLNASHLINRRLKKIGLLLGLPEPLTMYRARHAWASIAHANDVPLSVISEGMGHDSERTTRIYLASLDCTRIDNANSRIIGLLDS